MNELTVFFVRKSERESSGKKPTPLPLGRFSRAPPRDGVILERVHSPENGERMGPCSIFDAPRSDLLNEQTASLVMSRCHGEATTPSALSCGN